MVEAFSPEQIVTGSKLQEPWTHVDCPAVGGRRIVLQLVHIRLEVR